MRRLSSVRKNKKAKRKDVDRNLMEKESFSEEMEAAGPAGATGGAVGGAVQVRMLLLMLLGYFS